jgi:antitoxin CptB
MTEQPGSGQPQVPMAKAGVAHAVSVAPAPTVTGVADSEGRRLAPAPTVTGALDPDGRRLASARGGQPPAVAATLDPEARRLLWRCRRGMKELDIILDRFARAELPEASAEQRRTFARFLELPDPLLADYLLGYTIPPESDLAELVRRMAAPPIASPRSALPATAAPEPQPGARPAAPGHAVNHMAVPSPLRHDPAPKRVV